MLIDKEVDNTVDVDNNGQIHPETEAEGFVVNTVQEDDNDNDDNSDDDDDNKNKKDEDQNDYYDDKEPAPEEEDDNEMGNDNNDDSVNDKTINEQDVDDKVEQENWYYKAKFMLDWVNTFSQRYCVHSGFAISIDEMMKLFKGCSTMTHRIQFVW